MHFSVFLVCLAQRQSRSTAVSLNGTLAQRYFRSTLLSLNGTLAGWYSRSTVLSINGTLSTVLFTNGTLAQRYSLSTVLSLNGTLDHRELHNLTYITVRPLLRQDWNGDIAAVRHPHDYGGTIVQRKAQRHTGEGLIATG